MLRGAVSLGALTMLTGCDPSENEKLQSFMRAVSAWNDRAQSLIFRPNHLAPTFSESQVVKPPRFNAYYEVVARQTPVLPASFFAAPMANDPAGTTTYAYNEHGQLTTQFDARGITATRTVDPLDRTTNFAHGFPVFNV